MGLSLNKYDLHFNHEGDFLIVKTVVCDINNEVYIS